MHTQQHSLSDAKQNYESNKKVNGDVDGSYNTPAKGGMLPAAIKLNPQQQSLTQTTSLENLQRKPLGGNNSPRKLPILKGP